MFVTIMLIWCYGRRHLQQLRLLLKRVRAFMLLVMKVVFFRVVVDADVGCAIFIKIFTTALSSIIVQLFTRLGADGLLFVNSVLFF